MIPKGKMKPTNDAQKEIAEKRVWIYNLLDDGRCFCNRRGEIYDLFGLKAILCIGHYNRWKIDLMDSGIYGDYRRLLMLKEYHMQTNPAFNTVEEVFEDIEDHLIMLFKYSECWYIDKIEKENKE